MRYKILIVDDQPLNVTALQRLLRPQYDVITAGSTEEALTILTREGRDISLILSDKSMPGRSGLDLLADARSLSPAVRILLTAYPQTSDIQDAINRGEIYRYIIKPWEPEEIDRTVREAIDHYQLAREQSEFIDELKRKNEELRRLASRVADALLKRHQTLGDRDSTEMLSIPDEISTPHPVFVTLSYASIRDAASSISTSLAEMKNRVRAKRESIEPEYVEMVTNNCLVEAQRILNLLAEVSGSYQSQKVLDSGRNAVSIGIKR